MPKYRRPGQDAAFLTVSSNEELTAATIRLSLAALHMHLLLRCAKRTKLHANTVSVGVISPGYVHTRVGTLIVATIYLQLIQNRDTCFGSFTVLQYSHQHCVQPVPAMWKSQDTFRSVCSVDSSNGAAYRLKNLWNSSEANATKWFLHLRNQVEVTRA